MKKRLIIPIVFIIMIIISFPLTASASQLSEEEAEISGQIDEIMYSNDISLSYGEIAGLSFGELWDRIKGAVVSDMNSPIRVLGTILIVSVFTAVMKTLGDGILHGNSSSEMFDTICAVTAAAAVTPRLLDVYGDTLSSIERSGGFILVFVPLFAGITAAVGGIVSGGLYNVLILAASEILVGLSQNYLMPVLSVSAVLAISGSVFPNASTDGIVTLLKKVIVWGMTISMTLFTGFLTLKCSLAGKADGVATKTAKFLMSGFVPIVGGAVSDAYSTVRGGFEVMRGTVGTAGIFAVVLIMLPPILRLLIFRGVMWAGTAVAELLSAQPVIRLLKGLDSGLSIAQSVLICYSLMFILCTSILMNISG